MSALLQHVIAYLFRRRRTAGTEGAPTTDHAPGNPGASGMALLNPDCANDLVHAVILGNSAKLLKHTSNTTNKLRVLICEDDDEIAVLCEFLLRNAGFDVEQAEDAETARLLIKTTHYDIMILDLGLPGIDGISFVLELEKAGIDLPVIVVSANASSVREKLQTPPALVIDWIDKPVAQQRLVDSVIHGVQTVAITGRRILHIEDDPDIIKQTSADLGQTLQKVGSEMYGAPPGGPGFADEPGASTAGGPPPDDAGEASDDDVVEGEFTEAK